MVDIINKIYRGIIQRRIKRKYPGLSNAGNCVKIKQCTFEGYNAVHSGATLYKCLMGRCSYVGKNSQLYYTRVGRYCSIADNVIVCIGNHPTQFGSTFPSFYYDTSKQIGFSFHKGQPLYADIYKKVDEEHDIHVDIGNDVWIGSHALLLGGVRIGDGAVIGAGSVVTKDVEPYSIVAGVPAKIIRKRFDDDTILRLLQRKWWNDPFEWVSENYINYLNVEQLLSQDD